MVKDWKWEVARDCIALGSIPFYFVVAVRAVVGKYMPFVYTALIAFIVLVILSLVVKKSNAHVSRAFILWVFTSLFYKHNLYTIFTFLILVLIIISANYLKVKKSAIIKGIILGIISTGVAYYLADFIKT